MAEDNDSKSSSWSRSSDDLVISKEFCRFGSEGDDGGDSDGGDDTNESKWSWQQALLFRVLHVLHDISI